MYRLTVQKHPVLFVSALAAGIAAIIYFPHMYAAQLVEIPLAALYAGEIGLALLLTLLFYENASPGDIVRLTCSVLGVSLLTGAIGNYSGGFMGSQPQFLPDSFVLINWIELVIMNLTGILATLTLYRLRLPDSLIAARTLQPSEPTVELEMEPPMPVRMTEPPIAAPPVGGSIDEGRGESVQEILDSLDVSRINRLEKSLQREKEPVSLEALFKEENAAASKARNPSAPPPAAPAEEETHFLPGADSDIDSSLEDMSPPKQLPSAPKPAKSSDDVGKTMRGVRLDRDEARKAEPTGKSAEGEPDIAELLRGLKEEVSKPKAAESSDEAKPTMSRFQQLLESEKMSSPLSGPKAPDSVPQKAGTSSSKGGIFGDVDSEIDNIFGKMVSSEAHKEVSAEALKKVKQEEESKREEEDRERKEDERKRSEEQKEEIKAAQAKPTEEQPKAIELPAAGPAPTKPKAADAKEVKEFARLSSAQSVPGAEKDEQIGTMKTIGKMLLDVHAVENIIRAGEHFASGLTTARILSEAQGKDLDVLLENIAQCPGIDGSVIVGHDGLVMASQITAGMDKDVIGAMSMAINNSSNIVAEKVELGKLHQIVLQSDKSIIVITDVGEGVLSVLTEDRQTKNLNNLLRSIHVSLTGEEMPEAPVAEQEPTPQPKAALAEVQQDFSAPESDESSRGPVLNGEAIDKLFEDLNISEVRSPADENKAAEEKAPDDKPRVELSDTLIEKVGEPESQAAPVEVSEPKIEAETKEKVELESSEPEPITKIDAAPEAKEQKGEPSGEPEDKRSKAARASVSADQIRDLIESLAITRQMEVTEPESAEESEGETEEQAPEAKPAQEERQEKPEELKPEVGTAPEETEIAKSSEPVAEEPSVPEPEAKPALHAQQAKEVKEFGRLSTAANTAKVSDEPVGAMKSIGKMLIDAQAVGNIIKAGETSTARGLTTARVISAARGEGIRALLAEIDNYPDVSGSLIVGHDGLVIASTLTTTDKDMLGAMSTAMHSNTNLATEKLDLGKLQQTVLVSKEGLTVLTEVDVGVLAVFSNTFDAGKLDGLRQAIEDTIRG